MSTDSIADAVLSVPPEVAQPAPAAGPEATASPPEAEAAPAPAPEVEVTGNGFVGRLVLESQTVRKLVPLRVCRDCTIRMRLPGERPPPGECYHVVEYNNIIGGKQRNHVGLVPDFPPVEPWAMTPEMKRAGERWITEHWDVIAISREFGGRNKSMLVGNQGRTRRY